MSGRIYEFIDNVKPLSVGVCCFFRQTVCDHPGKSDMVFGCGILLESQTGFIEAASNSLVTRKSGHYLDIVPGHALLIIGM
jgi:hypothetical protein